MKKVDLSRRSFLHTSVAGLVAPFIIPRHTLGGKGYKAASDTLAIACIGVGGMGRHYLKGCAHEKIVALCDLDFNFVNTRGVFEQYPGAARYRDYRRMLDKEHKNFDAIIIAVPDHHHAILLSAAMQLRKHIYCAKPITHTIGEARTVKAELKRYGNLVTKASVQDSGTDDARSTTELLTSGILGPIRELHIWTDHPIYPCSLPRPSNVIEPPSGMDWDMWIGPAPWRPFHPAYHPENWRPWWDFGSGTVGDMACHAFHIFFSELKMHAPTLVYAYGSTRHTGFMSKLSTPECQSSANRVTWEYPKRDELPPLKVHWYDGGIKPERPEELRRDINMPSSGLLFVGDNGKLISGYYGGNPFASNINNVSRLNGGLLLPEDRFKSFDAPPKSLPRCEKTHHYREWTEACKTNGSTTCPVEFGCDMTEVALLGTIALRTQKLFEWDSASMSITNDKELNQWVAPEWRKDFHV